MGGVLLPLGCSGVGSTSCLCTFEYIWTRGSGGVLNGRENQVLCPLPQQSTFCPSTAPESTVPMLTLLQKSPHSPFLPILTSQQSPFLSMLSRQTKVKAYLVWKLLMFQRGGRGERGIEKLVLFLPTSFEQSLSLPLCPCFAFCRPLSDILYLMAQEKENLAPKLAILTLQLSPFLSMLTHQTLSCLKVETCLKIHMCVSMIHCSNAL